MNIFLFFQALSLLLVNVGCSKTLTILIRWPAFLLMPLFSIFTFSTERIGNRDFLVCSTKWTIVNLIITLAGLIFGAVFVNLNLNVGLFFIYCAAPMMFIAIVNYAILMTVKSCICASSCCPLIKRSGLDIQTLEIVFLEDVDVSDKTSGIEMQDVVS